MHITATNWVFGIQQLSHELSPDSKAEFTKSDSNICFSWFFLEKLLQIVLGFLLLQIFSNSELPKV